MNKSSALANWTPEQIALGKRWVETWNSLAKIWSVSGARRLESSTLINPSFYFAGPGITPNLHTRPDPGPGSSNNNDGSRRQPDVNEVIQAAAELQAICQTQNWEFCFIGGLALQRWSEPRETVDVDLSLFADFGDEQKFCDVLLEHFAPRISDAAAFAQTAGTVKGSA